MSTVSRGLRNLFRPGGSTPVVTWTLAGVTVFVWLLEFIPVVGDYVLVWLAYMPARTVAMPWTMVTAAFLHSTASIWHILFNMYALVVFGPVLELMVGRWRFLLLYLGSAFGGSVAVLLLADPRGVVIGASGAIFGLFAAFFVIQRGLGNNPVQFLIVIVLNLVVGFIAPGVSWQAHVGGLVAGAAIGWVYVATRGPARRRRQAWLLALVLAALVILTVVGVTVRLG